EKRSHRTPHPKLKNSERQFSSTLKTERLHPPAAVRLHHPLRRPSSSTPYNGNSAALVGNPEKSLPAAVRPRHPFLHHVANPQRCIPLLPSSSSSPPFVHINHADDLTECKIIMPVKKRTSSDTKKGKSAVSKASDGRLDESSVNNVKKKVGRPKKPEGPKK
ncbi:hypothetical protein S245_066344, partial [Arachis hypogaea]